MALGRNLRKSNHDTSLNDRYAALAHEMTHQDAGVDLQDAMMADLTRSIQEEFQGSFGMIPGTNATNVSKATSPDTKPMKPKAQQPTKLPIAGKVGHINVSDAVLMPHSVARLSVSAAVNQTQINENKTKAIEEVAVSLPMASFALEDPQPKTEQKFPGNASQKAAWDKKEESLEKQVEKLKVRLTNASDSLESTKRLRPKATGTFNSQLHGADAKLSDKPTRAKGPEPMEPLRKDEKPKANWPTMGSVAAPVGLHHVDAIAVPPQKEAIREQEGKTSKVEMGTAFTGTPAKKVESILAFDSVVEHDAMISDDENSAKADTSSSTPSNSLMTELGTGMTELGSWMFSWLGGEDKPSATVVDTVEPKTSAAIGVASTPKTKSLIWVKQDTARTAQATHEEHQHIIEVNDAWNQMEKEDSVQEESVHREDVAERQRAQTPEMPHKPTKSELQGRHGAEMSGFWSNLEREDYNIEQTVQSDDLVKYAQLTQAQDTKVSKASDELETSKLNMDRTSLKHDHNWRLAIHEPWLRREVRDKALERQVHESPDLQMLQLQHRHQHK